MSVIKDDNLDDKISLVSALLTGIKAQISVDLHIH